MTRRVLIQAGHNLPRQPGFESGTGTAGEMEYVADIQARLRKIFASDGRFDVTYCPGQVPEGWSGDIFLSLHCDGSASPSSAGYCRGYPPAELGPRTRVFLAAQEAHYAAIPGAPAHRRDNYTSDLSGYYGFHHCRADVKVLVEHGFLTNPTERLWLDANRQAIARSHYLTICRYFSLTPRGEASVDEDSSTTKPSTKSEWLLAQWYLGIGKYKGRGRRQYIDSFPPGATRPRLLFTKGFYAAVSWYQKHVTNRKAS